MSDSVKPRRSLATAIASGSLATQTRVKTGGAAEALAAANDVWLDAGAPEDGEASATLDVGAARAAGLLPPMTGTSTNSDPFADIDSDVFADIEMALAVDAAWDAPVETTGARQARLLVALAPLDRIVVVRVPMGSLMGTKLDHKGGFLMSRVDGVTSIEDLLDLAGMPMLEALTYLSVWLERGYISLE
jgi:hypothetical protein